MSNGAKFHTLDVQTLFIEKPRLKKTVLFCGGYDFELLLLYRTIFWALLPLLPVS